MRREADDIGPRAELDHWKKRMSKFNYLLDQIKGSDVKAVLGVLQAAKSKIIKVHVLLTYRCQDTPSGVLNSKFKYAAIRLDAYSLFNFRKTATDSARFYGHAVGMEVSRFMSW